MQQRAGRLTTAGGGALRKVTQNNSARMSERPSPTELYTSEDLAIHASAAGWRTPANPGCARPGCKARVAKRLHLYDNPASCTRVRSIAGSRGRVFPQGQGRGKTV